jgi:hypothetical protein
MRKPAVTRIADKALNPAIGKSLVVYATKPAIARAPKTEGAMTASTAAASTGAAEGAHAAA